MTAKRLPIRMWRVSRAEPYGLHVWFDPDTEVVRLFEFDPLEPRPKTGVYEVCERDDLDDSHSSKQQFLQEELPF